MSSNEGQRQIKTHFPSFVEHLRDGVALYSSVWLLNRWRLCLSPPFVQSGRESALMREQACGSPSAHRAGDCQSQPGLPGRKDANKLLELRSLVMLGDRGQLWPAPLSRSPHVLLVKCESYLWVFFRNRKQNVCLSSNQTKNKCKVCYWKCAQNMRMPIKLQKSQFALKNSNKKEEKKKKTDA